MTALALAQKKAEHWRTFDLDIDTRNEIDRLEKEDEKQFIDSFYSDLEFGTGGLRGVMGVGSMRMNRYTVGMATQGLANYINRSTDQGSVAIAYDSRNLASFFASIAADVLSANGIRVFLFNELRPTPLLSFAVRELGCTSGIVITASHNPKEYNGYKVYWNDGGQILPPHDAGIIQEVRGVAHWNEVKKDRNETLVEVVPSHVEEKYLRLVSELNLSSSEVQQVSDLGIVYTSIHGSGITLVPKTLAAYGFKNVKLVQEQSIPDGNFPTVESPNPEERSAMKMALDLASKEDASLVLGTDPDTDRVGIGVRNNHNELVLLNGNQAGSLLVYYRLKRSLELGILPSNAYVAKTIVTSDLIDRIAKSFQVPCYETLTGFKFIAGLIGKKEGSEVFIAGGEESYGYLVGEFVRDKDAALSSVQFAEIAAYAKANGTSIWNMLLDLYKEHGCFQEELVSITLKGIEGIQQIKKMMNTLRTTPPQSLGGVQVAEISDYLVQRNVILKNMKERVIELPKSDVLQFILEDGSKISVRPSGTEPKIKFYFSLRDELLSKEVYNEVALLLNDKIHRIKEELLQLAE
ncbi:MAG: phospho-sugar mutase [Bacteroidota bacterium]|jgi:phosphoglucomutase